MPKRTRAMTSTDWLELARDKTEPEPDTALYGGVQNDQDMGHRFHVQHGQWATDGMRLHLDISQDICTCRSDTTHNRIGNFLALLEQKKVLFTISRKKVLEALAGIAPDDDTLEFGTFMSISGHQVITISAGDDSPRAAIIAQAYKAKP